MATSVSRAQEKAEEKRQRKRAKKMLKQEGSQNKNPLESVEAPKKRKSKKSAQEDVHLDQQPQLKNKKKKKTETTESLIAEISVETKKAKKRKRADAIEHDGQGQPPLKKKLSILQQIEGNSGRMRDPLLEANQTNRPKQSFPMPSASQKLKKIIPENVEVEKKRKKTKKSNKKVIPEPELSPPKPVWSSAGVFIEEPKTPFKFTSTQYVPIRTAASTKFGVVVFEANKMSKKHDKPPQDFRTQSMLGNKKRDGSMKNIRGLLGKHNTF